MSMSADPLHPWRHRRRDRAWKLWVGLLLAVLGHLVYVGVLLIAARLYPTTPAKPPARPVSLRSLSADQWARNRAVDDSKSKSDNRMSKAKEREREKDKKDDMPKGQVVDVAPGNQQKAPDAKYLAEHDNKVDKETRAREQTPFYRNAMPQRTTTTPQKGGGHDQAEKPQVAGNNGVGNDDRPLREAGKQGQAFEVPDQKRRHEVAMRTDNSAGPGAQVSNRSESAEVQGNSRRLKIQPGEPGGGEEESSNGKMGAPGALNLMPSASVMDKLVGGAPNDRLDVDEGDGTFLNTKEWKYASFFNRVKQSVGMHWDPGGQLRQRDPTGNIYGGRDRHTILSITLNERGMVKDIYVEKSCGLDFLDLEAIKSFERAQPFPNPPPGLLGGDQAVRFSFGFFLEMGSGPRMRLFRQGG